VRRWFAGAPAGWAAAVAVAVAACGSFGSEGSAPSAEAGVVIGAGGDATIPEDAGADAGPTCLDALPDLALVEPAQGGTFAFEGPVATLTFAARVDGGPGGSVVRVAKAVTMPPDATFARVIADVELDYVWDSNAASWSDDAYVGVVGLLAGTVFGDDPQASLTISQGRVAPHIFPRGTNDGGQRVGTAAYIGNSNPRVALSLLIDYADAGVRASGTGPGVVAFRSEAPGDVGVRPADGAVHVYVGGGAGGATAPAITMRVHRLCVVFGTGTPGAAP
jgi:hypothetical protein